MRISKQTQAQILEDFKQRASRFYSPDSAHIACVAAKYHVPTTVVRRIIEDNRKRVDIKWRILKSPYKGMRQVVIKTLGGEISWHTTQDDRALAQQIEKYRHRMETGFY